MSPKAKDLVPDRKMVSAPRRQLSKQKAAL